METLVLEKEEIEIKDKILTDTDFVLQNDVKPIINTYTYGDFAVIILQVKNPLFKHQNKSYDLELCGKKMWQWVALAVDGYPISTVSCTPESDILLLCKPYLSNKKFTAILYSDTPLLQKTTIEEIFMYARSRDINAMRLLRGYVFNTEYLKQMEEITVQNIEKFNEEDFFIVSKYDKIPKAISVLNKRIVDFHISNGVMIINTENTIIESDVIIDENVKIYPNNYISGTTFIGKNTILYPNNIISNSIIGENCTIISSSIDESKVNNNVQVAPFTKLKGQIL